MPAFILNTYLSGQNYMPFYLDSAEWTVATIYPVIGQGDGGEVWQYQTKTDTIINDSLYTNITKRNLCEYWPDRNTGERNYVQDIDRNEYLIGAIREINQRLYFYNYNTQKEILLYNYDIEIGDTIYFNSNNHTIILEELTPHMGHRKYKVLNKNAFFYPHETSTLIEGIGSSYGLFGSYEGGLNSLVCFRFKNEDIYGECEYCEGFVTSVRFNDIKNSTTIKPNPVASILYIENDLKSIEMVEILSINGASQLKFERVKSNELHFDVSQLKSGIYIAKIMFVDQSFLHQKFIKVN